MRRINAAGLRGLGVALAVLLSVSAGAAGRSEPEAQARADAALTKARAAAATVAEPTPAQHILERAHDELQAAEKSYAVGDMRRAQRQAEKAASLFSRAAQQQAETGGH